MTKQQGYELGVWLSMLSAALLTWNLVVFAGFTLEGALVLGIGSVVVVRGLFGAAS